MMTTNLSVTHLAQLTGILTGGALKRSATKEAATKRFASALHDRVGSNIASESQRDILQTADFSVAKAMVEAAMRAADEGKTPKVAKKAAAPKLATKTEKKQPKAGKTPKLASPNDKVPSKRDLMLDMVCRKGGATEAEICKEIGWKKCLVTLRRAAAASDVALRTEKVPGGRARYFGTRKA